MTDILERLQSALRDETQVSSALHQDAVDEIERLRQANKELQTKLEHYYKMGEAEF